MHFLKRLFYRYIKPFSKHIWKIDSFKYKVLVLGLGLVIINFIIFFIAFFNKKFKHIYINYEVRDIVVVAVVVVVVVVFISSLIINFLNNEKEYRNDKNEYTADTSSKQLLERWSLDKNLNELLQQANTIEKIQEVVYDKTMNDIENTLIKQIENKYEKYINFDLKHTLISNQLQPIIRDTEKYIDKLQRNSIINLIIGIIGTSSAILILAATIFGTHYNYMDIIDFLINFLPKLTFVISIELFAFFFLRLYKNNLEDAKYFQNELTNLNSKTSALKIAHILNKDSQIDELIKALSITERNFKLNKDETMQTLEKAKIEKDIDITFLTALSDFLKTYKK